MKIKIGPYRDYIGPYQIADALCFWLPKQKDELGMTVAHPLAERFGEWLSGVSFVVNFCSWLSTKRKRKISIEIDPWDTWNMDSTLAHIIHPMLVQLQSTKHGSPCVDDGDVPEHLRSTNAPPKENEWDTDALFHDRWEWVMNEMIWAFNELKNDKPGEDECFTHPPDSDYSNPTSAIVGIKLDKEKLTAYNARMENAFRLFGRYYQALWD